MTERQAILFTKGDVIWYKNNHQTSVKKKIMQKLMMQCHIKCERFYVPEYIISTHFYKIESWFVAKTLSLY